MEADSELEDNHFNGFLENVHSFKNKNVKKLVDQELKYWFDEKILDKLTNELLIIVSPNQT